MSTLPPELIARFTELLAQSDMKLPPPVFLDMDGEIVDIDMEKKTLTARFPVKERYQNPMGYMQGGMIATAIDNAIGPLSFLVTPPNVTRKMEVTYLKPVKSSLATITIVASFTSQKEREVIFEATVFDDQQTKLVHAKSINFII